MRPADFEAILNLVEEYIMKKDANSHINASVCSIFLLLAEDILFLETYLFHSVFFHVITLLIKGKQ